MSVSYGTLVPTNDPISYTTNDGLEYPPSNVVDTFSTIWVSKVHGKQFNVFEVASSGKIALTPSDEHSLDVLLDDPNDSIVMQARNGRSLKLTNENDNTFASFGEDGSMSLTANSDATLTSTTANNSISLTSSGMLMDTNSGSNLFVVSSSETHRFDVEADMLMNIASGGIVMSNVTVEGTDFRVPKGNSVARPTGTEGQIFYNTDTTRFEGYAAGAWSGLGGTVDVDQDTYVSAESSPNADNDQLLFYTAGVERMKIDTDGETTMSNVTLSNLTVDGPDFRVPAGIEADRPIGVDGQVYYNSTALRFEGKVNGSWAGLGGVVDIDQDTYIDAETNPDEDMLRFYTAGVERMTIDDAGKIGMGLSNPTYDLDIIGDVRISGNLIAASTSFGDDSTGKTMALANDSGSSDLVDGLDTNDGSGLVVNGTPASTLFPSKYKSRFEKSFKWRYGKDGMSQIAKNKQYSKEAYWEMKGGAFRMTNINSDSGSEVSYIFRISEDDQLEIVKYTSPTDGNEATYEVVSVLGNNKKPSAPKVSSKAGYAGADADLTSMNVSASNVDAVINSFSAYDSYRMYSALYTTGQFPTTAQVLADAAANGYNGLSVLPAATDNTTSFQFTAMSDGSSIPNDLVKMASVVVQENTGVTSSSPIISFVINDEAFVSELFDGVSQTTINTELRFTDYNWDDLTAQEQAEFEAWLEAALLESAENRGITLTSVDITFAQGSILADITMSYATKDSENMLSALTSTEPLELIGSKREVTFSTDKHLTFDSSLATKNVKYANRVKSAPTVNSVVFDSSSGSELTYTIDATDSLDTLSKVFYLVSDSPTPPLPASIVSHANKVELDFGSLVNKKFNASVNSSKRQYVHVVVQSSLGSVSAVKTKVVEPFEIVMPSGTAVNADGQYKFASQDGDNIVTVSGMTVTSDASTGTAYLMLWDSNESIPSTGADFKAAVDAGSNVASASLTAS